MNHLKNLPRRWKASEGNLLPQWLISAARCMIILRKRLFQDMGPQGVCWVDAVKVIPRVVVHAGEGTG